MPIQQVTNPCGLRVKLDFPSASVSMHPSWACVSCVTMAGFAQDISRACEIESRSLIESGGFGYLLKPTQHFVPGVLELASTTSVCLQLHVNVLLSTQGYQGPQWQATAESIPGLVEKHFGT